MLWSSETFVDFEHGLNTAIKELRGVLSDSANQPRYIETLPKLGYRLIVPVSKETPLETAVAVGQTRSLSPVQAPQIATAEVTGREIVFAPGASVWTFRRYRWLMVAAALLLLVAAIGYWQRGRARLRAQMPAQRLMLAVLPFENLTGDSQQEYFSDGLTEEMISQIGSLDPQHLGVIARTSAMHYKHTQESLDQIGRELGVNYILEGSLRRDSERVRISAQLIQVKEQAPVWAREYDRELEELLSVQSEIAEQIAGEIQLTLADHRNTSNAHRPAAPTETSYEAHDLYLKGLYFWNKRTFDRAADYFQQAINKDPNYARAYAALANTYGLMGTWSVRSPNEVMPKARAAALKALELNGSLAEAHTALALIAERYDYDWKSTEREFRLAIQLDPGYATAHQWYGEYLSWQGRFDEAFAESERARQLDPMSLIIASDHASILYRARQYDRAITEGLAILEMDPNFRHPDGYVVHSYIRTGQFPKALDFIHEHIRPFSAKTATLGEAIVYGEWGRQAKAERALAKFGNCDRTDGICISGLLDAYSAMGRKDEAMALLQRSYAEHHPVITTLKTEPAFDPLRSDPRFKDLLRRVGLAE